MNKRYVIVGIVIALVAGIGGSASADMYLRTEVDEIDDFGGLGGHLNLGPIAGNPKTYTHDLTDQIDFTTEFVKNATLDLDFTNMGPDRVWIPFVGIVSADEYVNLVYDADLGTLVNLGEIDASNEPVEGLVVGAELINDDGQLDVQVTVFNYGGLPANISLDKSTLTVDVHAVPAPGAALLGVLGLSAAGIKLRKRRS